MEVELLTALLTAVVVSTIKTNNSSNLSNNINNNISISQSCLLTSMTSPKKGRVGASAAQQLHHQQLHHKQPPPADVYVVVYSVENRNSFEIAVDHLFNLNHVTTSKSMTSSNTSSEKRNSWRFLDDGTFPVLLVANKVDLVRSRDVLEQEGKLMAEMYRVHKYLEVSVEIGHEVDSLIRTSLKLLAMTSSTSSATSSLPESSSIYDESFSAFKPYVRDNNSNNNNNFNNKNNNNNNSNNKNKNNSNNNKSNMKHQVHYDCATEKSFKRLSERATTSHKTTKQKHQNLNKSELRYEEGKCSCCCASTSSQHEEQSQYSKSCSDLSH
ncbi:hypothetical protein HELRODRAFT_172362 [Helobdella robusta]|uniref:Small monomeric GTPase n=1 Tax=Helobdella robusta TaxID=6412 RepID=T1F583_HELRO|nr:hypothetical protein HELRODRAFT_172362 [Helobdella robusta]ESO04692.1 hypothetical protein HELRODRAFT_172362 [Helobdella robusta]